MHQSNFSPTKLVGRSDKPPHTDPTEKPLGVPLPTEHRDDDRNNEFCQRECDLMNGNAPRTMAPAAFEGMKACHANALPPPQIAQ